MRNSSPDPLATSTISLGKDSSKIESEFQQRGESEMGKSSQPEKPRRSKTLRKVTSEIGSEMKEAQRLRREKECIGSGFTNTQWLAAIDNAGETLVLHTADSVRIIRTPKIDPDDSESDEFDSDSIKKQVVSDLHVYTGVRFQKHTRL